MSDAPVVARLKDDGADPALVTVGPEGRAIVLDIPAGVELRDASLSLQAPGDDVTLDVVPGATLATSTNKNQLSGAEDIAWFSVDWGTRRPLTSVKVSTADTPHKGRLSVAEGGPWYPAIPFDTIPLQGAEQSLPGVTASRLLVEMVKGPLDPTKPKELVSAKVSGVVVKAAARPADLTATLEPGTLFFHQALPMQPLEKLTLGDTLSAALQRAWPAEHRGGVLTVMLRSSVPGKLRRVELALRTASVIETWSDGGEALSLPMATDGEAVGRIDVGAARKLDAVRFQVQSRLSGERLPLAPRPARMPALGQRCGVGFAAAQAFSAPAGGSPLVGVDLHLRPLTRALKGTLTLFPDAYDRPGAEPLKGATLTFSLEHKDEAPWPARWVSLAVPRPLVLPAAPWWAVLTVSEGEALWTLDGGARPASPELAPLTTLYRSEERGPWLPRVAPGGEPGTLWALARPRLLAPVAEPPPPPRVWLRWGSRALEVTPDEKGLVSLDTRALADFTPPAGSPPPPLEVVLQSRVSGDITLSGPRVTSPRTESFTLFPPK